MSTYEIKPLKHVHGHRPAHKRIAQREALLRKFMLRVAALRAEMDFLREGSRLAISSYEQRLYSATQEIEHLQQGQEKVQRSVLILSESELQQLREQLGIVQSTAMADTVVMAQYQQLLAEKNFHEQYGKEVKAAYDQLLEVVSSLQQPNTQKRNPIRSIASRLGKNHE